VCLVIDTLMDGSPLEFWRFSNAETVNYYRLLLLLNYLVNYSLSQILIARHESSLWRLPVSSILLILISLWQKEIISLQVARGSYCLILFFHVYQFHLCIRIYMWFTFLSIYTTKPVVAFFYRYMTRRWIIA